MLREIANALVRINLMKTFKTLIVDDEWLIRLELKRLLSEYPNLIVVGEAANLTEATRAVDEQKPDLIFLDIQMPGGSGFDFLEQVQGDFKIIFVTAFTHHRQNAGKYRAVDYLLKPISKERLARALQELMNSAGD